MGLISGSVLFESFNAFSGETTRRIRKVLEVRK